MENLTQDRLRALLGSPEAARLLSMLRSSGNTALQQAVEAAKAGDTARVQALLKPVLEGTDAAELAKALEQRLG